MAEIIPYLTKQDSDLVRNWVNREPDVAWIIKVGQSGNEYRWRAVDSVQELEVGSHCLWHRLAGPLNIPSGVQDTPDVAVTDPYAGWSQYLDQANAEMPWFGGNLPGPYSLHFRPVGREAPDSIGRSGFHWLGDRYRLIGKPAPRVARQWWSRLVRFVRSQATGIPWPSPDAPSRLNAYAFPDAYREILRGRRFDINP